MQVAIVTIIALLALTSRCQAGFVETFSEQWEERWIYSDDEKYTGKFAATKVSEDSNDLALKVTEKARHYGLATSLPKPIDPATGPVVLQYDLKLGEPLDCGGAYMKFLTLDENFKPSGLRDNTPYTVMFGPDVCGATNKVHLIIRHENQLTKRTDERHLRFPPSVPSDVNITHVYTAILYPNNNTYAVLIDGEEKKAGSLFEDFNPPFVPTETVPDPEDKKPQDWVDDAKIPDPSATKPEDWDEDAPETIPDEEATKPDGWLDDEPKEVDDPEAVKPDDWDDEEDGDWEPPQIPNPKCKDAPGCGEWVRPHKANPDYKGKWSAPLIDNPAYKGPWSPREIPNPEFFNDTEPLKHIGKIGAVAIEIWTMGKDYYFDNLVVTDSVEEAAKVRSMTWEPKYKVEKAAADAKAAEEAKEAEEMAKKAASGEGFLGKVTGSFVSIVEKFFESDLIAPYATNPPLSTVHDFLVEKPLPSIAIIAAVITLVLTSLVMPVRKEAAAVEVGQAKKKDITPPDDKEEKEIQEEEEEDENASPSRKSRRARRA